MTTPTGYVNPIGPGLKPSRIDMGVDYTGTGSLYAIGAGTIVNVNNSGWPGGKFIGLKLDNGNYVYYAENIVSHVNVGQRVQAGQLIGTAVGTYPYVEIGWAAPPGTGETMAAASGQSNLGQSQGDPGKYSTAYGVSMSNLISSLGGPAGIMSPGGIQGTVSSNYPAGTDASASSNQGCNLLSGLLPLIWMVGYAIRQKKEHRRNLSSREHGNRKSPHEKRKRSRRRRAIAFASWRGRRMAANRQKT